MIKIYTRKQIGEGIWFNKISDKRYKSNKISVTFYTDFDEISNADYEAVGYLLVDSCEKYPDYRKLSEHCAELYDADIESSSDFFGDKRSTKISVSVIDDRYALEGEKLEQEAVSLLIECILHPRTENGVFDSGALRVAASEICDAIMAKVNDKRMLAMVNASKSAYVGEPMSSLIEGTPEQAGSITPESVWKAYRRMIERGHIEIIAAGCSDFTECEKMLSEAFAAVNRHDIFRIGVKPSPLKSAPCVVSDKLPMQQAIIRMYFKAPECSDRLAMTLFSLVLGGIPTSRFFTNIREKQSLCYYCSSSVSTVKRTLVAYAGVEPKNVSRTKDAIIAEIKAIAENGVTDDELNHARLECLNAVPALYDNPYALTNWYIQQRIHDTVYSPEEYMEGINAVTSERIQQVARQFKLDTVYTLEGEGQDD